MPTLASLTGGDRPADTRRASSPGQRACVRPLGKASVTIPSVGVTVSFTPQALKAAAGLAHGAVKLGSTGAELVCDAAQAVSNAAQAVSDVTGDVVNNGVKAAIVGGAVLGLL